MKANQEREELFERVIQESKRAILSIARSYSGGDPSDLYQEILLQIWKGLDGFEPRAKLSTWAYRVALNTAVTFKRKAIRRVASASPNADDPAPLVRAGPRSELEILREFVASLGDVDRAVFLLYLEDLTYREMSEITGLQESNVGVRINRMKKAFVERYL